MGTQYSQLTPGDRVSIESLHKLNHSCRSIAEKLGVSTSTVSRELSKNRNGPFAYRAASAQRGRDERRGQAGAARRKLGSDMTTPRWRRVLSGLRAHWSPQEIKGRFHEQHPDPQDAAHAELNVSHETIYRAIYAIPQGSQRSELISLLRRSRRKRMPRARGLLRSNSVQNMTMIAQRPAQIEARIEPGHLEGDLIKGKCNRSAVGTLVDRTSRRVMLVKLNNGTAAEVLDAFTRRLKTIPKASRKTMTYDQGCEMAMHATLTERLGMKIYFCDPHSPWQRGSNENMNGLIREYLPKGMDLSNITHQQLAAIEKSLNNRPRKILGFKTPNEVCSLMKLRAAASGALQN